eukprot:364810-Chlamydomonas_euryale.AAC.12
MEEVVASYGRGGGILWRWRHLDDACWGHGQQQHYQHVGFRMTCVHERARKGQRREPGTQLVRHILLHAPPPTRLTPVPDCGASALAGDIDEAYLKKLEDTADPFVASRNKL